VNILTICRTEVGHYPLKRCCVKPVMDKSAPGLAVVAVEFLSLKYK
jgi:hypothetical protein